MKTIDFDAKFFQYARKWVAAHPDLNEDQVEDSYNEMMGEWMEQPADWLDGATPSRYFERFSSADELIGLMEAYSRDKINLPEPLYSRIVECGAACAPKLKEILADEQREESLRAEAMGLLRDIASDAADEVLIALVTGARESGELCDMAADVLALRGERFVAPLLDAYPNAPAYAQTLILDLCCNYGGDERIYQYLIAKLRGEPEQRALYASYLSKLGDARAIEVLLPLLQLSDLTYFDYIELRDAVEALGGDAGEERSFYGDPDYEALRNL